jgi:hypothetical protein
LDTFFPSLIILAASFAMIYTFLIMCVECGSDDPNNSQAHQENSQSLEENSQPQPTRNSILIGRMEEGRTQQILDQPPTYDSLFAK